MHSYYRAGWSNDPVMTEKPVGSSPFSQYLPTSCASLSRVILPAAATNTKPSSARDSISSSIRSPLSVLATPDSGSAKRNRVISPPPEPHHNYNGGRPAPKKAKTSASIQAPYSGPLLSPSFSPDPAPEFSNDGIENTTFYSGQSDSISTTHHLSDTAIDYTAILPSHCPPSPTSSTSYRHIDCHPQDNGFATPATPDSTTLDYTPSSDCPTIDDNNSNHGSIIFQTVPSVTTIPLIERARAVIQGQFNIEVLIKHRELERINQEMAKCQATLEQLRRCTILPYPTLHSLDVTGCPLQISSQDRLSTLADWGMCDGPYSRHYSTWLLQDSALEHSGHNTAISRQTNPVSDIRSSRLNTLDIVPTLSLRASRAAGAKSAIASSGSVLDGTANGLSNRDPLVLRRSTDGKLVRLVCNKCQKDQFANVQGFINHYRIQHHYGFKSHDAAAITCGQVIDEQASTEAGFNDTPVLPTPPTSQHITKPASNSTTTAAKSLISPPAVTPLSANRDFSRSNEFSAVHPLVIRSDSLCEASSEVQEALAHFNRESGTDRHLNPKISARDAPFSDLPHLSLLLHQKGFSGNLSQLIAESRMKVDLSALSDGEDDDEVEIASPRPVTSRSVLPRLKLSNVQPLDDSSDAVFSPTGADSNPGMMTDVEDDVEDEIGSPAKASKKRARAEPISCRSQVDDMMGVLPSHPIRNSQQDSVSPSFSHS